MPAFTPHPYQRRAIDHLIAQPSAALWMEMGLGKTPTTLAAIEYLLDTCEVRRVLVVAPKRVATSTWPAEVEKWGFRMRLQVVDGTPAQRIAQLGASANVWAINYELIPWLVEHYGKRWPFDMLVLDEASKTKHHATNRFRALRKIRPMTNRIIELTGTPAPNGLMDLWAQIMLLDGGERLGRTITRYRERWFDADYLGYHYTPRPGADAEIHAKLADICLTLRAEDYLRMPDYCPVTLGVDLPAPGRALYRTLEREMFAQLQDGTEVTATSAAALTNKCRQAANGSIYTDDGEGAWVSVHDAKITALRDLADEAQGEPILVAYSYRSDLERLQRAFPHAQPLDSGRTIDRWNKGQVPMLLAHPASAGHGLNLQYGGRIVAWFGLDWSLELYQQFNARLYRQGQTKPVFVYHIIARDTVDALVLQRLETKRSVQDVLLDALKIKEAA